MKIWMFAASSEDAFSGQFARLTDQLHPFNDRIFASICISYAPAIRFVSTIDFGATTRYCLDNVTLYAHTRIISHKYTTPVNDSDLYGAREVREHSNHEIRVQHTYRGKVFMSCWNDNRTVYWSSDNYYSSITNSENDGEFNDFDRFKYEYTIYHAEMVVYYYIPAQYDGQIQISNPVHATTIPITIIFYWKLCIR